jgi:hypothetical protein
MSWLVAGLRALRGRWLQRWGRASRRRVDESVLGAVAFVVGLAALAGAYFGRPEQVTSMWALAEVGDEGPAQVTEVIDYDFGSKTGKHGIFRVVPGLKSESAIRVDSPDAPDAMLITKEFDDTRIRIGDADQTVSGAHRYQIGYRLPGVRRGSLLAWDAVGTEWDVDIEAVEVHVVAPTELFEVTCAQGSAGSRTPCDDVREVEPGHVVAMVDHLDAHEGVTVTAREGSPLPAAPTAPALPGRPDDPGTGLLLPPATATAAALVGAAASLRLVRRAGRERVVVGAGGPADAAFGALHPADADGFGEVRVDDAELGRMATVDFAPPEGITAPQGGVVLAEHVQPQHRVAWLIETAIEGSVEIDAGGTRLVREGPGSPWTASILDRIFAGRSEVQLGTYDPTFASGLQLLSATLDGWRAGSGLWDERAARRRHAAMAIGGALVAVGLVAAVVGGVLADRWGTGWLVLTGIAGLLAGVGAAPVVAGWELLVRTAAGSAAWLRVESFRRFLADSEAYHAEEAAKRGVLREYTAWAVAVGEIDRWASAIRASTAIPDETDLRYAFMAPLLLSSTMSSETPPAPRFEGGGSDGFSSSGGSVGGGSGGGGGGSW